MVLCLMQPARHCLVHGMSGSQVKLVFWINALGQLKEGHKLLDELVDASIIKLAIILNEVGRTNSWATVKLLEAPGSWMVTMSA